MGSPFGIDIECKGVGGVYKVHQKSVYAKEVPDSQVDKVVHPVDITQPPPPATPVPAHEPLGHGGRKWGG